MLLRSLALLALPFAAAATTNLSTAEAAAAGQAAAAQLAKAPPPKFPDVTPLPAGKHRVCIFDFGESPTRGSQETGLSNAEGGCSERWDGQRR